MRNNNNLFYGLLTAFCVSLIVAIWCMALPAADLVLASTGVCGEPVEGIGDILGIVWTGVRVLFWCAVAISGTLVVLGLMAAAGAITWIVQRIAAGFVYVSKMFEGAKADMQTTVAKDETGSPVTVAAALNTMQNRLIELEKLVKKDEAIEQP